MWNVISSNRILDIQMRKESYRRHKNSIKNAKPQIVINSPAQYSFLVYKPKTKQLALCITCIIQSIRLKFRQKIVI